jgi:hypothetical protein
MWHGRGKRKMRKKFLTENLKGRDQSEDTGVDGILGK